MEYFGTNLTEHGHYRWNIDSNMMTERNLNFKDLPFHPEELTNGLQKGETTYYQGGGFSVLAIAGSPIDMRPGTKSVFWVKELLTKKEMKAKLLENTNAARIIKEMTFSINW